MKVLVVSPHPDDEAIGMGGTIRRHIESGDEVKVVFLTSGEDAIECTPEQREQEALNAKEILEYQHIEFWRFKEGGHHFANAPIVLDRLEEEFQNSYDAVFVPSRYDAHEDHKDAFNYVETVLRKLKEKQPIPTLLQYEVWTPMRVHSTLTQITEVIEYKMAAIRAHKSQDSRNNFAQGALGLAKYRAVMTGWKQGYVEVFQKVEF